MHSSEELLLFLSHLALSFRIIAFIIDRIYVQCDFIFVYVTHWIHSLIYNNKHAHLLIFIFCPHLFVRNSMQTPWNWSRVLTLNSTSHHKLKIKNIYPYIYICVCVRYMRVCNCILVDFLFHSCVRQAFFAQSNEPLFRILFLIIILCIIDFWCCRGCSVASLMATVLLISLPLDENDHVWFYALGMNKLATRFL